VKGRTLLRNIYYNEIVFGKVFSEGQKAYCRIEGRFILYANGKGNIFISLHIHLLKSRKLPRHRGIILRDSRSPFPE